MKIEFSKQAKDYINEKNIDNIVVDIDLDSKAACCGFGSVDFKIIENAQDKVRNFKHGQSDFIDVSYSPSLEFYFDNNSIMDIGCAGFFKFKKLYVKNEINVLAD